MTREEYIREIKKMLAQIEDTSILRRIYLIVLTMING